MSHRKSSVGAIAQRIKQADHTVAELSGRVTAQRRESGAQRQQIERLKTLLLRSGVQLPRDLSVQMQANGRRATP